MQGDISSFHGGTLLEVKYSSKAWENFFVLIVGKNSSLPGNSSSEKNIPFS
jgi:hypothetical protein